MYWDSNAIPKANRAFPGQSRGAAAYSLRKDFTGFANAARIA